MNEDAHWLSSREAARRLDVKLATLYAYASRGLLESVPSSDGKGRRYARASVETLRARHDARAGHGAVAASALRWGEPSLDTSISEIRADGPSYRGHPVLGLLTANPSFESVADLLWTGRLGPARWSTRATALKAPRRAAGGDGNAYLAAVVAQAALDDHARHGASEADELERARGLLLGLSLRSGGRVRTAPARAGVAERLLRGFGVAPSALAIQRVDQALVLCADHELNASTFAARVTASTGADLYACVASGLHALSGPKHGGVAARIEALLREIGKPERALATVRARLARGEEIPGFGHTLYAAGDPRAVALFELARRFPRADAALAPVRSLCRAMQRCKQPAPNLDAGLVAFTRAAGLPPEGAGALFAIGRIAGYVAHALEQRAQGYLLRPRSRYVPGPRSATG